MALAAPEGVKKNILLAEFTSLMYIFGTICTLFFLNSLFPLIHSSKMERYKHMCHDVHSGIGIPGPHIYPNIDKYKILI